MHAEAKKTAASNRTLDTFVNTKVTTTELDTVRAECMMTEMVVALNLPITASDMISSVVKKAFPDSKIASRYQCGRSKTTALIKHMAAEIKDEISDRMKARPYSLSTDGGNDQRMKQFPIVINLPGPTGVHQELLSVPVLGDATTGENIFILVKKELDQKDIPIQNCLCFGTDNANVMTGRHKGVYSFFVHENPEIYLAGCPCHLLHHAEAALPFGIDDILVNTYTLTNRSSASEH